MKPEDVKKWFVDDSFVKEEKIAIRGRHNGADLMKTYLDLRKRLDTYPPAPGIFTEPRAVDITNPYVFWVYSQHKTVVVQAEYHPDYAVCNVTGLWLAGQEPKDLKAKGGEHGKP